MDEPTKPTQPEAGAKIRFTDRRRTRDDAPEAPDAGASADAAAGASAEASVGDSDPGPVAEDSLTTPSADNGESPGELVRAQAEAEGYLADLQRLKAEFDNYRKRMLKEQTAMAESAAVSVIARLLSVLDNFDLAVAAAEGTRDFDRMLKGIELVYGELTEVLRGEGLERIAAKGERFDPNLHEAALEVPGDDSGNLVVAEELRPGYTFKGRVLRPAMVKVTQKGA